MKPVKKRKFKVVNSSHIKVALRRSALSDEESKKPSTIIPVGTILDPAKPEHREQIIREHKSITHLTAPENDWLRVFKTLATGFGVIAHQTIPKGEIICTYQGKQVIQQIKDGVTADYEVITEVIDAKIMQLTNNVDRALTAKEQEQLDEHVHQMEKYIGNYAFVLKKTKTKLITILGHQQAGVANLVNCSWNGLANITAIFKDNNIIYQTLREIQQGEEILIDYGPEYTDSKEFQHFFPLGSRSIKYFLEQNSGYYSSPPTALNPTEQDLLGTTASHVLVPDYYSDLKGYKADQINILPLIEIEMIKKNKGNQFKPLPDQQFITGLMYAGLKENKTIFNQLIQKKVCVNFVTKNGRSAWYILSANYGSSLIINKMCLRLVNAIYCLYDLRQWSDAYEGYLRKNLKGMTPEKSKALFAAVLTPRLKPQQLSGRKNRNYQKINNPEPLTTVFLSQEDNRNNKRKLFDLIDLTTESDEKKSAPLSFGQDECLSTECDYVSFLKTVAESNQSQRFSLLNSYQSKGSARGLNSVAIAVKHGHESALNFILGMVVDQHQRINLMSTPQTTGSEEGLTALAIAAKTYGRTGLLKILLTEVISANRFDLIQLPQKTGAYRGCSLLAIAIIQNLLPGVEAILKISDADKHIALLTDPQGEGTQLGMTAISIAIKYGHFKIINFLLEILSANKKLSLLNLPQPAGIFQGCNIIAVGAAIGPPGIFQSLLKIVGDVQALHLINFRQAEGPYMGLTPPGIAAIFKRVEILTMILDILPPTKKFDTLNTPQPTGYFQGCTVFVIAVFSQQLSVVETILKSVDYDQKISLILTRQSEGRVAGLTAIAIAAKLWNLDLLCLMLEIFLPATRLGVFSSCSPVGVEKNLTVLDIAYKYKKLEGLKLMLERIRPLVDIPPTLIRQYHSQQRVEIFPNESSLFSVSSQITTPSLTSLTVESSSCYNNPLLNG